MLINDYVTSNYCNMNKIKIISLSLYTTRTYYFDKMRKIYQPLLASLPFSELSTLGFCPARRDSDEPFFIVGNQCRYLTQR